MMVTRRRLVIGAAALGVMVALVTTAIVAFACTQYASISSPTSAVPGETVTGSGIFFEDGTSGTYSDVYIHWDGGQVVWQGASSSVGSFTFSFIVPQVTPGYHYLDAEQYDLKTGKQVAGNTAGGGAHTSITLPAPASQSQGGQQGGSTSQNVHHAVGQSSNQAATTGVNAAEQPAAGVVQQGSVTQPRWFITTHAGHAPSFAGSATALNGALSWSSSADVPWIAVAVLLLLAMTFVCAAVAAILVRRSRPVRVTSLPLDADRTAFVAWAEDVIAQAAEDSSVAPQAEESPAGTPSH